MKLLQSLRSLSTLLSEFEFWSYEAWDEEPKFKAIIALDWFYTETRPALYHDKFDKNRWRKLNISIRIGDSIFGIAIPTSRLPDYVPRGFSKRRREQEHL